jgi:hypothetical protein
MHQPNPMHDHRCGAQTRTGVACRLASMPNGRCRMHGGATPRGAASPHFKHGRYSTAFGGLAARVTTALDDPDRLTLRHEIALVDARLAELTEAPMDALAWGEAMGLVEQRRRLVESEQKRLRALEQSMSPTEAVSFVLAVLDVIKRHVADRAARAAIGTELERLIRQPELG